MNSKQKEYLVKRINEIAITKRSIKGNRKEVDFSKLVICIGEVKKDFSKVILDLIKSNKFSSTYSNNASLTLEKEMYLQNLDEIKHLQDANEKYNTEIFEKERALIAEIDKEVKKITDRIMFGANNEEAYQMLKEFSEKEYKI